MISVRISAGFLAFSLVTACAAPQPAPVIRGEPIYNKLGEQVGCERGVYIPGANFEDQCLPPEDCDPQTASTFDPNCRPPGRDPQDPGPQQPNPARGQAPRDR